MTFRRLSCPNVGLFTIFKIYFVIVLYFRFLFLKTLCALVPDLCGRMYQYNKWTQSNILYMYWVGRTEN